MATFHLNLDYWVHNMQISFQNNGLKKNLRVEKHLSVQPLPLTRPLHLPLSLRLITGVWHLLLIMLFFYFLATCKKKKPSTSEVEFALSHAYIDSFLSMTDETRGNPQRE